MLSILLANILCNQFNLKIDGNRTCSKLEIGKKKKKKKQALSDLRRFRI